MARRYPPGIVCLALLSLLALMAFVPHASAQIVAPPAAVQVGAGVTVPAGGTPLGWDVSVAGDVEIRPGISARIDYTYQRFSAEEIRVRGLSLSSLPARFGTLSAKAQAHLGTLDIVWSRGWPGGRGGFYLFGGPALALRRVTITSLRADGGQAFNDVLVDVCEPLWLECSGSATPYHRVQGIRRSVDVGLDVGGGVTFDVGLNALLFAEGRYVLLDGPSFRSFSGATRSPNASFVPLTAGIRFEFR